MNPVLPNEVNINKGEGYMSERKGGVKKYEAMFVIRPDLSEDERKNLFNQIKDAVTKNSGSISLDSVWAEKRKLSFPIKKHKEGLYYLLNFSLSTQAVSGIEQIYKINENILRVLITKV